MASASSGPAIEQIYQKKSQLEHILLRPDSYIGSIEKETKPMWVWDVDSEGNGHMVNREITYVPGLYKIFDEILVNAADNKQRDKKMNVLRIDINAEKNEIVIYNNGKGIPVTMHKDEKIFVPTMIFGHLLTSSNYNDDEKKVVGGRNGYGAKLCNIFSTKFKVETSSKEFKKAFSQVWTDNMSKAHEAKVTSVSGEDFTRVTFKPDLSKFKMDTLDKDIVALFSRRAFDVAATSKGVKVFLNGDRLPVTCFRDYVNLFLNKEGGEDGGALKVAHEIVNDRWEVAVATSEKGFQQISFVNSIATTRGGKHVDHFVETVVSQLTDLTKKKLNKQAASLKPHHVKNQIWVFVNCLIENPTFDSQTKETMTLQVKNFGSKCSVSPKFLKALGGIGAVENICEWAKFKADSDLKKKGGKKGRVVVEKYMEANLVRKKGHSHLCTLILTEGDSAKTLVLSGLGKDGRDRYGVFPLRGKLLNVREATHKQIMENKEINNIIKILGLQFKKVYETEEDLKSLRYGKLMIMTDQDQDGSHIKGLLINFIHHFWPSLLKLNFLEEFITPIVKVTKKSNKNMVKAFYSLPEFQEWKAATPNYHTWDVKYYKGLGTSTSAEGKEYFADLARHRIAFRYGGADDDHHVKLAFSKKMIEERKEWLTGAMEERKRRRELGLPELYLYGKDTRAVTYQDFVNQELVLFSNMDNERSIPSLVDGLKPGQRKVIFTCFKRNDKKEVKVAQLAGSVGEKSAYHHGEVSLQATIVNMAQDFVGSNNINLLKPNGQFGTRLTGGKDAASARYIFTMLSPLARKIFPAKDDPLMKYLYDDNLRIEPEYYVPIIPMVLVNGAEGIGTGWSTKIPNYDPRVLAENVKRRLRGEELLPLEPWYKGFKGTFTQVEPHKYVVSGEAVMRSSTSFDITELPIHKWTQPYRDTVLEPMLSPQNGQNAPLLTDVRSYYTDVTVHFIVEMTAENLQKVVAEGIHKVFKLQTTISTTSMVLFDGDGCLRRFDSPKEIFDAFFPVRMKLYEERKRYYEGLLQAEALFLDNQVRFIREKNDGIIKMEKVKEAALTRQLIARNYDSDPVKAWKRQYAPEEVEKKKKKDGEENDAEEEDSAEEEEEEGEKEGNEEEEKKKEVGVRDFNYLLGLQMRRMLLEHAEQLIKTRDDKHAELTKLQQTTPAQLWVADIDDFLATLDEVETKEKKEAEEKEKKEKKEGDGGGATDGKKKKPPTKGKKKKGGDDDDDGAPKLQAAAAAGVPPARGERVQPSVDLEKYQPKEKKERKKADKTEKTSKRKREDKGSKEEDGKQPKITQLLSPKTEDEDTDKENGAVVLPVGKPTTQKMKLKQTTLSFKPPADRTNAPVASTSSKPPAPSKDVIKLESDSEEDKPPTKVVTKKVPKAKKAIAKTKKRVSADFESDDDEEEDSIIFKTKATTKKQRIDDDDVQFSDDAFATGRRPQLRGARKKVNYKFDYDSDSDSSEVTVKSAASASSNDDDASAPETDDDDDDIFA